MKFLVMMLPVLLTAIALSPAAVSGLHSNMVSREYCQMETFEASCPEGHVILMEVAKYGRMKLGKCLTRDYYVGCAADVTAHLHGRCSGRRECTMLIPDPVLFQAQPCPDDLVAYLEASYSCVPVAMSQNTECNTPAYVDVSGGGYLSTLMTQELSVGSQACPWRLFAHPGQRINFTLLDFAATDSYSVGGVKFGRNDGGPCTLYGYILDGQNTRKRICGVREQVKQHIYVTEDHQADVIIEMSPEGLEYTYGLLQYQVIGCPLLDPPVGGWVEMKAESATVHCNFSTASYHLVCDGNQWVGQVRNCSQEYIYIPPASRNSPQSLPYGLFIAIAIGLALGIMIGVTLLLVVFILCKRRKNRHRKPWMSEQGNSLLQKQAGKSAESSLFIDADPRNYPGTIHVPCDGRSAGSVGSSLGGQGDTSIDHRRLIQLMPLKHANPAVPIYDTHPGAMDQSECLYYTHPVSQPHPQHHQHNQQQQQQQQQQMVTLNGLHECDSGVDGCSLVDCSCPGGGVGAGGADVVTLGRMGIYNKDCGGTANDVMGNGGAMATRLPVLDRQPDITDTSQPPR